MRMKNGFLIFSGFLGSGKTSMMITLSKELEARGLPAATISNDLGARGFVDTAKPAAVTRQSCPARASAIRPKIWSTGCGACWKVRGTLSL